MISYSLLMQIFFMNKCTGTMRRTMKWGHSVPEHVWVRLMLLWLCPWGWCSPSCRRSLPHAFWEAVLMAEETRRCWFAGCLVIERQFLTVWSALKWAIWIQQWFCCWKGTQKCFMMIVQLTCSQWHFFHFQLISSWCLVAPCWPFAARGNGV